MFIIFGSFRFMPKPAIRGASRSVSDSFYCQFKKPLEFIDGFPNSASSFACCRQ
jgi:hypothetical protein